ncbi:MAG: VWA domain-containing protein, partial [Chloroflexi bacterium]|nr:VWA domain-containing protein [Chloroflexota bacterium]
MVHYLYSRWDGTQDVDVSSQELIDELSEQILEGGDLSSVLRRMMRHGADFERGRRMMGLEELRDRLRAARERNLERYDLTSMFDDLAERLEDILAKERGSIAQRLDEMGPKAAPAADAAEGDAPQGDESGQGQGTGEPGDAALEDLFRKLAEKRLEQLDRLPSNVGGRIKELRDYDFLDPEARQQFEELLQMLQQQVLQNYFKGMQQGLENMTPEQLREIQQMVTDLNKLIQEKLRGEEPDITEFMAKWGHLFPEGIETFAQLMEHMQAQMQQMQTLLNSMPSEMRDELSQLMEGLLRDHHLQWDLFELAQNMERLNPGSMSDPNRFLFSGDEPVTLQEALRMMGELNSLEELEDQMREAIRYNDAGRVDADEVGRLLGEESKRYAEELQELTKRLEEAGFIQRKGQGWELTPQAIRKIGEKALKTIFSQMNEGRIGDHDRERTGIGIEQIDETKPWVFGDPFHLNTLKTVTNAVLREGPGTPVHIKPEDFEINQTHGMSQCSTVIALDMSASMMWSGYFQAGQRVGLALDTLIRTKYPKDNVTVMAFSYFVLPLKSTMLLDTYWVEYGG